MFRILRQRIQILQNFFHLSDLENEIQLESFTHPSLLFFIHISISSLWSTPLTSGLVPKIKGGSLRLFVHSALLFILTLSNISTKDTSFMNSPINYHSIEKTRKTRLATQSHSISVQIHQTPKLTAMLIHTRPSFKY